MYCTATTPQRLLGLRGMPRRCSMPRGILPFGIRQRALLVLPALVEGHALRADPCAGPQHLGLVVGTPEDPPVDL